ncbi:RidA family protein [Agrobacterium sp. SOY23]|uniref:RidA family protein n=1 Tax=Agrobacterium sp. SOY23 TaxID=3014555 RepID=UPI0022AE837B|nr:RidA family protein [Agrobacterium sp. SOY23]MCZ4431857.1 RidA family protein [Agrobacterium sp. SOY23]
MSQGQAAQVVGAGDVIAQTRQVLSNLREVLAAAGTIPADVVGVRTYVVNHSPENLATICGEIAKFYDGAEPAANTFIGVQTLALPDFLIEIEATACLP